MGFVDLPNSAIYNGNPTCSLDLAAAPGVGGYMEGTFTGRIGSAPDAGHDVSGSFHVLHTD